MIELLGSQEGAEFEAATHLRRLFLNLWPDLARHKKDILKIFVGLKLYGHKIEDIDLFVVAQFESPRSFAVEFPFCPKGGDAFVPRAASVKNLALVIEVKSHDATGVRFEDTVASVRYWSAGVASWQCVTDKNRAQMFEVIARLQELGIRGVWLQHLVLFMGLKESDLPKRPHNCIAADASLERILNVLGQVGNPIRQERHAYLTFGPDVLFEQMLAPQFQLFKTLEPTPLDRRRMDVIAKAGVQPEWLADLGKRQLLLRGRGGVGKTVMLLQMAYRAFDSGTARSLVLAFNKALVADMRRTMALLGVPRNLENGGVTIDTVHALVGKLLVHFGLMTSFDTFLQQYDSYKQSLLSYLTTGAISADDLGALRRNRIGDFGYDYVFVDEGQDWPSDEIEILRVVFGTERLVIADGVDQFVRGSIADWSQGLSPSLRRTHKLTRCLRMKANLARFVSEVALELGIKDWDLEPNTDAVGGRVLIVEGDLAHDGALFQRLRREALDLGNYPIDMLACVPPNLVDTAIHCCVPAVTIQEGGGRVWDGSIQDVREHFPTDRDALRIVQYDSCRGLEGWTVIAYAVDEFWEYKRTQWLDKTQGHNLSGVNSSDDARANASRWAMIPLTRAIDTLVLNVTRDDNELCQAINTAAAKRQDIVERIVIR